MKWQDYEFDEAYRPSGFEEWSQEKVNVGYAFYLRDKYITDDTGLYEDTDEGTIHIFCPHFGETFEEDEKKVFGGKEAQSQCHCGSTMRLQASCPRERECEHTCKLLNALYPYYGVKKKDEFAFYQRTDRGMLLRAFTCTVTYPGERYELRRFGDTVYTEWLRVFYNADRTTEIYSRLRQSYSGNGGYFTCIGSEWTQKKKFQGYAGFTIYGEDLAGTLLEGFTKYFALMEGYITNETQRAVLLLALFRTPALKEVIKAGYLEIAKGYVNSLVTGQEKIGNVVRGRAKTITKFFGFELSKLDKLSAETKVKLTIRDIQTVKRMLNNRIAVTPETLAMCGNYRFNDLCVLYEGKALRWVIRYLRRQDIKASDVISDYLDYLGEVKTLRLDERNPEVLYPRSLSRAHARLSRAVEYQTTEKQAEKFAKKAAAYAEYCYRQKNLSLRVIRTASELMKWSQRFCNCSHGYVDNVANGYSLLCVIVDVRKPKDAYFMLDYNVKTHSIAQCRGYHNYTSMEDDPRVERFCGQWLDYIGRKEAPKQRGAA